jgi:Adenylate and Guanylate cyclase catalytic domain
MLVSKHCSAGFCRLRILQHNTIPPFSAVAGLPVPRSDHAAAMALFASECLRRFAELSKKLEIVLGPGTGSLALRVGLHSGPVTAGVLRGDNARFQLFGDVRNSVLCRSVFILNAHISYSSVRVIKTVNVAAKMESTGEKGRIHVSQETATILMAAGKKLTLRDTKVETKGKGSLQTYWLNVSSTTLDTPLQSFSGDGGEVGDAPVDGDKGECEVECVSDSLPDQVERLIDWNANNLVRLLRVVEGRRCAAKTIREDASTLKLQSRSGTKCTRVLDEVREIIMLPKFDPMLAKQSVDIAVMDLNPQVAIEARIYVQEIAHRYQDNPFHNFEHVSTEAHSEKMCEQLAF